MLALELPPHQFSNLVWPVLEEYTSQDLHSEDLLASYILQETDSPKHSPGFSPDQPKFELDDLKNSSLASEDFPNMKRKLNHNAYERSRRKKLNDLYGSLRSLLPETDRRKNLSIPSTVSHVLKYIPELQRQVGQLTQRKEEILLKFSRQGDHQAHPANNRGSELVYPVVSTTSLNDREVMVQICNFNKIMDSPLSFVLKILEGDGLQLMNASTFPIDAERSFCCLHLQAKEAISMECKIFRENLTNIVREKVIRAGSIRHCM